MSEIQELLSSLFEQSYDFVCLANLQSKPFFVNTAGRRLLGIDAAGDVSAVALVDIYAKETWSNLRQKMFPALKAIGRWEGEGEVRHFQTGEPVAVAIRSFLAQGAREPTSHLFGLGPPRPERSQLRRGNGHAQQGHSRLVAGSDRDGQS